MIRADIVELARRASLGDAGAFDELCQKTAKDVFLVANRMLNSKEDIEDVMQDTFLDMFESIDQLRVPEAIYGWILHIVRNNCKRLIFGRDLTDATNGTQEEEINAVEESEREVLPETAMIDRESSERLQAVISSLGQFRFRIVSLYYFAGLSCLQIGKRTGISARDVATNLHRARAKMRHILKDDLR
jgi:RNA polymerase sigma-70 factor (ECF subfamily)